MNQFLSPLDYVLWGAIFVTQWGIVFGRRDMRGSMPRFVLLLCFMAGKTTVLLALSFAPYALYFWTFYAGMAVETILLLYATHEIFDLVFQPVEVLPRGSIARMLTALAAGLTVIVAAAIFWPAQSWHAPTAFLRTLHRSAEFVVALAMWSLVMYARSLAIPWRSRAAGVAAGLLLWSTGHCFVTALMGHAPQSWVSPLNRISMFVSLLTLAVWFVQTRRPDERASELPTPEALLKLNATVTEMRSASRRLVKVLPGRKLSEE